jgi:hypothetical protein
MNLSPGKLFVLLLLGLAACVSVGVLAYLVIGPSTGLIGEPPDPGAAVFTQAARTLEVQLTSLAASAQGTASAIPPTSTPSQTLELPTLTPRPTNTPLKIASSTPVNTPTPLRLVTRTTAPGGGGSVLTPGAPITPGTICNAARFVEDVTFPDESKVNPGIGFTKTWRLQNTGFCPWTTSYSLEFVDGDQMGAPEKIPLTDTVEPGETVDLSVNFISPSVPGDYQSYWKLSDPSGNLFGVGASADRSIWVIIEVSETDSGLVFDFVGSACSAKWESGAGNLPCPGKGTEPTGFVYITTTPELETRNEDEPALITHPEMEKDGYITGIYPPFEVKDGDFFRADIGCMADSEDCNVVFQLNYRTQNGSVRELGEWQEEYDDQVTSVLLDLSDLEGKRVEFILTVLANGSDQDDNAFWLLPQIERD